MLFCQDWFTRMTQSISASISTRKRTCEPGWRKAQEQARLCLCRPGSNVFFLVLMLMLASYVWTSLQCCFSSRALMLCVPVFIFTSSFSAILGRPRCGLLMWLSLLAMFDTLFWVCVNFFHEKTDKTRKYSAVWYENCRRRLLGAQSINTVFQLQTDKPVLLFLKLFARLTPAVICPIRFLTARLIWHDYSFSCLAQQVWDLKNMRSPLTTISSDSAINRSAVYQLEVLLYCCSPPSFSGQQFLLYDGNIVVVRSLPYQLTPAHKLIEVSAYSFPRMQTTTTTTIEGKTLTNARTSDVFNRQTDFIYT